MENAEKVVKELKKKFGDESIMILGQEEIKRINVSSTGSMVLDKAIGIGGFPYGRIIEIFGPESSGKTTLALHAIAEVQKAGQTAAFIDAENALDIYYAKDLGVDIDNLILSQPNSGENALEITNQLIQSKAVNIIVIDSVAALVPQVEIDGEMNDQTIGAQARLMSKALRKMTNSINQSEVIVIFINQLREKVGVMFGSPEVTSGGRALKFYSSVRIDIRKCELLKENGEAIGIKSRVKVIKNKLAPPFKQVELDILYGEGISTIGEIIDLSVEFDILKKSGSWYSYGGEKIGQGRENTKKYFQEHQEILTLIKEELLYKLYE